MHVYPQQVQLLHFALPGDIVIYLASTLHLTTLIKDLKMAFEISDLGNASFLLSLHITYISDRITLTQELYIGNILSRFGMEYLNMVSIPLPKGISLRKRTKEQPTDQVTTYQSIIGSLMYLVTRIWPNLGYTISFLAQFSSCPTEEHIKAAKHLFRYVNRRQNLGLFYPYIMTNAINVYFDADIASCLDTRRSTWGYIVLFNNCCISWLSKKQTSISKSITKAEFVAISYRTRHIRGLLKGLADLHLQVPITIHADNTGANFLAVNPGMNVRTKHIAVLYFITREALEDNLFVLLKVESVNNLPDIFTKILARSAH